MHVDGARFLPSNVTITKVIVSLYSHMGSLIWGARGEAVCHVLGEAQQPTFRFKVETCGGGV